MSLNKIRISSWALAAALACFGAYVWLIVRRFLHLFAELEIVLPLFTRVILFPTPPGWFIIFSGLSIVMLWKDLSPRQGFPNWIIPVFIALIIIMIVAALFLPLMTLGGGLRN